MKTLQHFIATEFERKVSKTYGGSIYTLRLYENLGKGNLKQIGLSQSHCARAHKGEVSEAYTDLVKLGAIKPSIIKAIAKAQKMRGISGSWLSYYSYDFPEQFGLKIEFI